MKTKAIILLTLLAFACLVVLTGGCTTATSRALADIAKSNAASNAHVKIEVDIPPNRIRYERWVPGDTNAPAR